MRYIINIILMLFISLHSTAAGQLVPVKINDAEGLHQIGKEIQYRKDRERKLTFSKAAALKDGWTQSESEILNFSFTNSPYWLRFGVENNTSDSSFILRLAYPLIDSIEVYHQDKIFISGDTLPFHQRHYNNRNFIFPLQLKKGNNDIYIRVESTSSLRLPLEIMTLRAFMKKDNGETAMLWIFYGLMFFIFVHNLFLFFTVKGRMYGAFSAFIFSWTLYEAAHNGIGFQFLWPAFPWFQAHSLPLSISLSIIFISLFFITYLEARQYYPTLYKTILALLIIPAAIMVPVSLAVSYVVAIKIVLLMGIIASPLLLVLTLRALSKQDARARYLFAGFIIMLTGQLLSNLLSWDFLPYNTLTNSSVQIGSAVVVIVFSLGLSDSLNTLMKKLKKSENSLQMNNQELSAANEQLQAALEELEATNEEFEAQNEELIASQQELVRNEEQLNIMLKWLPIPVAIDNNGSITLLNQAFKDQLEFNDGEITTTDDFMRRLFPVDLHRKEILRYYFSKKKSARDGEIIEMGQHHVSTKNGAIRIMEIRVTIADPLLLVILHDITEQQKSREMMIETEKMMALGGLAAGMAHEINNPLGIIMQGVQATLSRLDPEGKKNQEAALNLGLDLGTVSQYLKTRRIYEYLNGISEAGGRAAAIVKNMLSFSRKGSTRRTDEDINLLLDNTIKIASSDYDLEKGYDFKKTIIEKEYQPDLPKISCIRGEIQQVFLNLIRNASQAMSDRGEVLPTLHLTTAADQKGISITFADNGPGIKQDELSRIFEPFFTTKTSDEGTGLGLSVSHFIITERHHGTISVSSREGEGTSFSLFIPFKQ